jgi:apolipoprotein N-acyltransferase
LLALLAFPPINLWPLSWFALLPLIFQARNLKPGLAFRRGWWGGLIFNAGLLYWIALNSGADRFTALLSFAGMLLVFPLYWGIFTCSWALLHRRWGDAAALLLPAVWVGLEVIKNAPEISFPWQELGLAQINFSPAAQLAEIGGIRLVSVWVVGINAALFLLLQKKRRWAAALLAVLLAGLTWGAWRGNHLPAAGLQTTILLVQGNVDPAIKWQEEGDASLSLYEDLTRAEVKKQKPDLVLWPETAIPKYLAYQFSEQGRIRRLAVEIGAPILTGAPHYQLKPEGGPERFNSAFFFPADGGSPLRYDKMHLVPFGERVPFQRWFPKLGELNFGQAEFTAGRNFALFPLENGVGIAPQICYESVFGDLTRHAISRGARLICNMTNDGWYGNSSGPYQHAALVRFRAIESRCSLVRAANTGISLAVNPSGKITDQLAYGHRGALVVRVTAGSEFAAFYTRHGEIIVNILAAAGGFSLLIAALWRKRAPRA